MGRKIFLSYPREDTQTALKFINSLTERGYEVWIDQKNIAGGEEWRRAIQEAVDWASDVVVILTPDAVKSPWVQHEGSFANGRGKTIHPILAADLGSHEFPVWAQELQYHDFLAVDFDAAFEKLCAVLGRPDPVQELLDDRQKIYAKSGVLIGEEDLHRILAKHDQLIIDDEAAILIQKSERFYQRSRHIFLRQVMAGGALSGFWSVLYFLHVTGFQTNFHDLETPIILIAAFLPGSVAGVLFALAVNTIFKTVPEKQAKQRLLRCALLGGFLFGGMMVIQTNFMLPLEREPLTLLWRGLSAALWGLTVGAAVCLARSPLAIFVASLISGIVFGGVELLARGPITWFLPLMGALLPLTMILVMTYWDESDVQRPEHPIAEEQ